MQTAFEIPQEDPEPEPEPDTGTRPQETPADVQHTPPASRTQEPRLPEPGGPQAAPAPEARPEGAEEPGQQQPQPPRGQDTGATKPRAKKARTGRQLHRQRHPGPRGAGGRPEETRHVHRLDRPARHPPPRLRDSRQLRGRGHGRPLRLDLDRHRRRRRGHRGGQRPGHPGRQAPPHRRLRPRDRHDHPARGREVRRRGLQGLGRAPRRRRIGRERPLGTPPGGGQPGRPDPLPGIPAGRTQG